MGTGYPRSPLLLKGALIELTSPFLIPVPQVVVFQYNPETVSRTLTPWAPAIREPSASPPPGPEEEELDRNVRVQPYDPEETLSLSLILDATDAMERPDDFPVGSVFGVADRLAALERLLYPIGGGGGLLSVEVNVSLGSGPAELTADEHTHVERKKTPIILFVWGPGRIVPVRIRDLHVTEKLFNPLLYPIRAEVQLGLRVLTEADFEGDESPSAALARVAYKLTRTQQDLLALGNLVNTLDSVGVLPR